MSGIGDTGFHLSCWYQRDFEITSGDEWVHLHFGAVDYRARVWVNGHLLADHEGGSTPFTVDITHVLDPSGTQRVTVWAEDNPQDLAKPRGKQDWLLEAHSIWYPRTSGIWQTVWVEKVPHTYLERLRWTPHLEQWQIGLDAFVANQRDRGLELRVKLCRGDQVLLNDRYEVMHGEVRRLLAFSDPGIDDYRNELLWSPEKPTLIDASLQLWQGDTLLDDVQSYTAMRSVNIVRERFMLNKRPYYLRLVLDQGYWPGSFMTAPSDDAFRTDIELVKAMGFNGVRKHQKLEDPRYLYWADVLGLLVWEEMPSAYRFTHEAVERLAREWTDAIDRDFNHPCIVVWVPFNESWGVPDLYDLPAHRHCVQALYHLTKTLDPSRPTIGNDGWESSATDIIGIHDYDRNPQRIARRYGPEVKLKDLFERRLPGGRVLTLDGYPHNGQPVMLTEFGGICFVEPGDPAAAKAWGYSTSYEASELQRAYVALLEVINEVEMFSGFCYTQFTDTFQEANGLLFADRRPKIPLDVLSAATRGGG